MSTALKCKSSACNYCFTVIYLVVTDYKLLKIFLLPSELKPIDDKRCLNSRLLIIGDFL